MEKQNNNIAVIVLLLVIIAILATLCVLFATDALTFNKKDDKKDNTIINDEKPSEEKENKISSKLVSLDTLKCESSETTFNGITVKVELAKNEFGGCGFKSFTINGKNIDSLGEFVDSYEIYDNNVIILSGTTSSSAFTIYSLSTNDTIMRLYPDTLEGYWVDSYKTNNNKIIITGRECGLQCANTESGYPRATFEIEYNNNSFSSPKLVEKFTS